MIDNSVWVETVGNSNLKGVIVQLCKEFELRSCEIIESEVRDSAEGSYEGEELGEFYRSCPATGVVNVSDRVREIASRYLQSLRLAKKKKKLVLADLLLAACAAIDSVDYVLTFNRMTLASDMFQAVYRKVNEKLRIKTPTFLIHFDSFRQLLV